MNNLKPKISIIGCGNVGMRYAYALIIKGIAREIVIVDIDTNKLKGEVMDLNHCAPFISLTKIIAGEFSDILDSDLVVITVGKKQEIGQTRLEILKNNVDLFKQIIPEIMKYAPNSLYLVATNPVDILSYVTYKISKKKSDEIIGSGTLLDSARLRFRLSEYFNVDPHNIHAYILGEHGDSEVPIWSKAMIGGILLINYFAKKGSCFHDHFTKLREIFEDVRDSAYEIIEKKGETSYGIGLSLVRITQAILNDENAILPVSCYITNHLDIDNIFLSLPAVINKDGVREVLFLDLNDEETINLKRSAEKLKKVLKGVGF